MIVHDPLFTNTIVKVFSQCIAIPTFTFIAANLVEADVVTTTIAGVTLIAVYKGKFQQE